MDITSLGFLLFLGGGVTLFYSIPQKYRWKWLIVLSFAFVYAASTIGLFFVVLTSVIVYFAAKRIEKVDDDRKKKILILSMGACLFILIFLKYLSGLSIFTHRNLLIFGNEMTLQNVIKKYLLPIGMSYYTLQVVSYLLDVYWGRMEAEQNENNEKRSNCEILRK